MNSTILLSEAREEARRLTKVTSRSVEPNAVTCACDYSPSCYLCGGEGLYYTPVYAFCDHAVQDGDDLECDANDCARKEREAAMVERAETWPRVSPPLKSCRDMEIEEQLRQEASEFAA